MLKLYQVQHLICKTPEERLLARQTVLSEALETIEADYCVSPTTLRRGLTANELKSYQLEYAATFPVPTRTEKLILLQFNQELRRADRLYAQAGQLAPVGWKALRRNQLMNAAKHAYNHSQEMLLELLSLNPRLAYLFDRIVTEESMTDEPEGMPRRVNSTSELRLDPPSTGCYIFLRCLQWTAVAASLRAVEAQL